jgi:uncharacterized protein (TIGR02996 family)
MTPRQFLLEALRRDPEDSTGWLALADCLEEEGEEGQAELLRLTRRLPSLRKGQDRHPVEDRILALIASGVEPCVPEFVNSLGMRFVYIPPGRFRMGSMAREQRRMVDEKLHTVHFSHGFWMGRFPVTQNEYQAITRSRPSHFTRRRIADRDIETGNFPVESVSWIDAVTCCGRLNQRKAEQQAGRMYRLATEAEWEYACRAGISNRYPFHVGESLEQHQANFACCHPYPPDYREEIVPLGRPCPVGCYRPNAWGLYDMHGNVDEWCQDWYHEGYYYESPPRDPVGPFVGDSRILRGGSWRGQGEDCRAAVRIGYNPEGRFSHVGFRLVCEIRPSVT